MFGKLALGAAALTTAASGGVAATQADFNQNHDHGKRHRGPAPEVRTAIASNDFDAWYDAVTSRENSPLAEIANEDIFAQMVEIHEMRESGDTEGAKAAREALREELGLPDYKEIKKEKRERPRFDQETHEAIKTAVGDGDYDAFAEILRDNGAPEEHITEDHFERMMERFERFGDGERQGKRFHR